MKITVHLHTVLQLSTADGLVSRLDIDVPENCTIQALMTRVEIKLPLAALLAAVNGRLVPPDHILHKNDVVHFMPAIAGGSKSAGEV